MAPAQSGCSTWRAIVTVIDGRSVVGDRFSGERTIGGSVGGLGT
jgi:hypothetical protein